MFLRLSVLLFFGIYTVFAFRCLTALIILVADVDWFIPYNLVVIWFLWVSVSSQLSNSAILAIVFPIGIAHVFSRSILTSEKATVAAFRLLLPFVKWIFPLFRISELLLLVSVV